MVFKQEPKAIALSLRVLFFMVFGVFALVSVFKLSLFDCVSHYHPRLSIVFFFTLHHGSDLNIVVSTRTST